MLNTPVIHQLTATDAVDHTERIRKSIRIEPTIDAFVQQVGALGDNPSTAALTTVNNWYEAQ